MIKWTIENLQKEASKYSSLVDFMINSNSAYQTARKRKLLNTICIGLKRNIHWDFNKLQQEALKYKTRSEFQNKSSSAYLTAQRKNVLDQICSHMPKHVDQSGSNNSRFRWTYKMLQEEALKYKTRLEFQDNSSAAYASALRHNLIDKICSHMKRSNNISYSEKQLFNFIKEKYPKTQKLRDRKIKIKNKPLIKAFELDIYIPELHKGIEFDGTYWHSAKGLMRSRSHWPMEDIKNYHKIKDEYFLSKNIKILHINEEDWLKDKDSCIKKCLEFLGE